MRQLGTARANVCHYGYTACCRIRLLAAGVGWLLWRAEGAGSEEGISFDWLRPLFIPSAGATWWTEHHDTRNRCVKGFANLQHVLAATGFRGPCETLRFTPLPTSPDPAAVWLQRPG